MKRTGLILAVVAVLVLAVSFVPASADHQYYVRTIFVGTGFEGPQPDFNYWLLTCSLGVQDAVLDYQPSLLLNQLTMDKSHLLIPGHNWVTIWGSVGTVNQAFTLTCLH